MASQMLEIFKNKKLIFITLMLALILPISVFASRAYADVSKSCDDGTIAQAEVGMSCQGSPSTATYSDGSVPDDPKYAGCPGSAYAGPKSPSTQCPASIRKAPTSDGSGSSDPAINSSNKCDTNNDGNFTDTCPAGTKDVCGRGKKQTEVKFNFGCLGNDYPGTGEVSPTEDLAFAIVRFLSNGVGIVVIISVIIAGFRYSAAQGNPQATAGAIGQIRNALIGLLIYIFMWALIQFLVPGGVFN